MDKLLLVFIGILVIWLAITGKTGVFLASVFVPSTVKLRKDEESDFEPNEGTEMIDEDVYTSPAPSVAPSGLRHLK